MPRKLLSGFLYRIVDTIRRMDFLGRYVVFPGPQALELSDFDVEHDALDAAGGLRALAAYGGGLS